MIIAIFLATTQCFKATTGTEVNKKLKKNLKLRFFNSLALTAVTTCMYSLPKFGLFLFIADDAMFYTVLTTSLAYLQYTYSFCEVPFFRR